MFLFSSYLMVHEDIRRWNPLPGVVSACIFCLFQSGAIAAPGVNSLATPEVARTASPFVSFMEKSLLNVPDTRDLVIEDMDGDGHFDILYLTSSQTIFWISVGDGKGGFSYPKKYGYEPQPDHPRLYSDDYLVVDFDGDGIAEIIYIEESTSTGIKGNHHYYLSSLSIHNGLLSNKRRKLDLPRGQKLLLLSGDIDGDNMPNIIIANDSFTQIRTLGYTSGWWERSDSITGGSYASRKLYKKDRDSKRKPTRSSSYTTVFDMDGDGYEDLVSVSENILFHVRGSRSGLVLDSEFDLEPYSIFNEPLISHNKSFSMLNGRFAGGKSSDMMLIPSTGKASLLINRKENHFRKSLALDFFKYYANRTSNYSVQFISGDFNGDGFDDIVTYDDASVDAGVRIFINSQSGYFYRPIQKLAGLGTVRNLVVSDINGDKKDDLIVTMVNKNLNLVGKILINITQ